MEVILLADVKSIGNRGELKKVSDGFGRNFLLRKKLAILATPKVKARFKHEESVNKSADQKKVRQTTELIDKLSNEPLMLTDKANEEGTLFSGISQARISDEIKLKYGDSVEHKAITITEPIKKIGDHAVNLKIGDKDITIKITVKKQ